MLAQLLISAEQLLALQAAGTSAILIDAGFDLFNVEAGLQDWRAGHLPGSHYLHLDRDLAGAKTGRNGRHPLPEKAAFARTLGRFGVSPATPVVALDRQGGVYAARVWWMLRWMGHAKVAVLDGGVAAWVAAGGSLVKQAAAPIAAEPYPDRVPLAQFVDAAGVSSTLGRVPIIDARSPERYRGEVEPLDAKPGHIPGALNRFFKLNLNAEGRFKPPEALRAEFGALLNGQDPTEVVHQCGSGVTACHNMLAMECAGMAGSRLYPGSWSEWSADPQRPVALG